MPITDQVATAPCTDPIQVRPPTFEARLSWEKTYPEELHLLTLRVP